MRWLGHCVAVGEPMYRQLDGRGCPLVPDALSTNFTRWSRITPYEADCERAGSPLWQSARRHPRARECFSGITRRPPGLDMTPESPRARACSLPTKGSTTGFLARVWFGHWSDRRELKVFILACVIVAGGWRGITAKPTILLTQAAPAALAMIALIAARKTSRRRPLHELGPDRLGWSRTPGELSAPHARTVDVRSR